MNNGLYAVFEGIDGSGKSTLMQAVYEQLSKQDSIPKINLVRQPGTTALGQHLRQLIKTPEIFNQDIVIDGLSRQVLNIVDSIAFKNQILEPARARNEIILADRSTYISTLAYGFAEGLSINELTKLVELSQPPRIDRLYVLNCPLPIALERVRQARRSKDFFDQQSITFFEKVADVYENLLSGPAERLLLLRKSVSLDNVIYVDATMPVNDLVQVIIADLLPLLPECTL